MPQYFFHVRNQTSYERDEVGVDLAGLDAARDQAANSAGEILTSDLRDGKSDVHFDIQIEDADDTRLMTLHVAGTVEAGAPAKG